MKQGRCGVYEWFLVAADKQTAGAASKDALASKRVINIANKLVDYHHANPLEEYRGTVRYLVYGEPGPFHFEFRIDAEELQRNLSRACEE